MEEKINPITISAILILILFSFHFLSVEYFTVKSYWNLYKSNIEKKDFSSTYLGFYSLEKFILWLDKKIPDNNNLIVLIRGEPIYLMSEFAFNLYPKDVKFINISVYKKQNIIEEIKQINERHKQKYKYIIVLSEKDKIVSYEISLVDSYRNNSGFIYYYNPK